MIKPACDKARPTVSAPPRALGMETRDEFLSSNNTNTSPTSFRLGKQARGCHTRQVSRLWGRSLFSLTTGNERLKPTRPVATV